MDDAPYKPTPAQIREACRRIREGWTPEENVRRQAYGTGRVEWQVPGLVKNGEVCEGNCDGD